MKPTMIVGPLWLAVMAAFAQRPDFPNLTGPYLGQPPPGNEAVLFAPGIVSTGLHDDHGPVFSKDGAEMYGRISGNPFSIVYVIRSVGGRWLKPEIAPFSGKYDIVGLALSPDGNRLYFSTDGPLDDEGEPQDADIWYVNRVERGWDRPVNIGTPVNTPNDDYIASVTGDTPFYTIRRAEAGRLAFFRNYSCRFENGRWTEPRMLDYPFNSDLFQTAPVFSPDGTAAVMAIRGRDNSLGQEDLYVVFRRKDGAWTEPRNLGRAVNSNRTDWFPSFSPDGKYLFFVSWRTAGERYSRTRKTYEEMIGFYQSPGYAWGGDVYWVSTKVIDEIKSGVVEKEQESRLRSVRPLPREDQVLRQPDAAGRDLFRSINGCRGPATGAGRRATRGLSGAVGR